MRPSIVLVISADQEARRQYAPCLARAAGFATICTDGIADARRTLEAMAADVVLLDLTRGHQWQECASLTGSASAPPVVVLTAWVAADGRFRRLAFSIGCAAFIAKPCHTQVLVGVLRRVLDGERFIAIA